MPLRCWSERSGIKEESLPREGRHCTGFMVGLLWGWGVLLRKDERFFAPEGIILMGTHQHALYGLQTVSVPLTVRPSCMSSDRNQRQPMSKAHCTCRES